MSAPTHRRPRSRASLAAAAGALPLAAAAVIAPTMPANAAPPASLAIYDAPGWANDYITAPTTCTTGSASYTSVSGGVSTPVIKSWTTSGRQILFTDPPGTDQTVVSVTCTDTTSQTYKYSFETKPTLQSVAATQEPKITDKPGTGNDVLTLTNLPGVEWIVNVTASPADASVDGEYHSSWFKGKKTEDIKLPSNTTSVEVIAQTELGFTFFKAGSLAPVAASWDLGVNNGPAALLIPSASEPKSTDSAGTSNDSITLTKLDSVNWSVVCGSGSPTSKSASDFGAAKTVTLKLSDLCPSTGDVTVSVTAVSADPSKYTVFKADGKTIPNAAKPYRLGLHYTADNVTLSDSAVTLEDNPGTAKDALVITSPSAGVKWTVTDNGVPKDVAVGAGKTIKVPITSQNVSVAAASMKAEDYIVAGTTSWAFVLSDPAIDLNTDPLAPALPIRPGIINSAANGRGVAVTGVDNISYTINGNAVTVATGIRKAFAVPGTGQIVVVAKSKAGFPIKDANGADGSYTWAQQPVP